MKGTPSCRRRSHSERRLERRGNAIVQAALVGAWIDSGTAAQGTFVRRNSSSNIRRGPYPIGRALSERGKTCDRPPLLVLSGRVITQRIVGGNVWIGNMVGIEITG